MILIVCFIRAKVKPELSDVVLMAKPNSASKPSAPENASGRVLMKRQ